MRILIIGGGVCASALHGALASCGYTVIIGLPTEKVTERIPEPCLDENTFVFNKVEDFLISMDKEKKNKKKDAFGYVKRKFR